ncbi:MAG: TolB family protein, partial [Thermoanaerobaculia bacterium]
SLDDRKLAVSRLASWTGTRDIWLYDLSRDTSSRFTFDPSTELSPFWSPDASRIVFSSDRAGALDLYQRVATGGSNDELLLSTSDPKYPNHWSPDGRYIVYESVDPKTKIDLWVLPLFGDRKPILYLQTGSDESQGQISPDGRWMLYQSNETGRSEIYVQAFPISGGKWQISTNGGVYPRWRGDGKEIFYLALDRKMTAVGIKLGPTPDASAPAELFPTQISQPFGVRNPYAVTADGQRFLVNARLEEADSSPIAVVVNWDAGLKK